jgi:hypothetical protein
MEGFKILAKNSKQSMERKNHRLPRFSANRDVDVRRALSNSKGQERLSANSKNVLDNAYIHN